MSDATLSWLRLPPEIRHEVLISLTLPRLSNPESKAILFRKRNLIRYIWFRVELQQYNRNLCEPKDRDSWGLDDADNSFIADAFQILLSTLSTWEPRSDLVLDISVYSPSDTQHWFKYLSFHPDTHLGECLSIQHSGHEQEIPIDDQAHGWVAGRQRFTPNWLAIEKVFDEIMCEGPFEEEEEEMQ
ncbi:hypothetical protein CCHL11_09623 [Colletotrichum chlorophyti]|uniref:Uncharacterized protein n=1 Tax=Colletotrichum chlorophyti TaxID=708187 RepID=A0A1Q8S8C6_9PEZI|nr:hypothetical protein CCHL11_09623 [Colletotrichum chlorophyti]